MRLLVLLVFIGIYVYEFNYISKRNLPDRYAVVGVIFMFLQVIYTLIVPLDGYIKGETAFNIGYFMGSFIFAFLSVFITCTPIVKYKNNINSGIITHYKNIMVNKNIYCARSEYWLFVGTSFLFFILFSMIVGVLSAFDLPYNFLNLLYFISIVIIVSNIYMQSKRLQDAGISRWFLLIYLGSIFGSLFATLIAIIMLIVLCLPSQEIPTTNIKGD